MTTAIDLKSPLEYFFWAFLSYESLSYEYTNHGNKWTVTCHSDVYHGFGSAVSQVLTKKKALYELMLNMLEGAGMDTHKWRAALQ